jgi:hypothetical protein
MVEHQGGDARLGLRAAKTIRYKVCNDEFHATPELVCQARDVIESAVAMRAVGKAPAATGALTHRAGTGRYQPGLRASTRRSLGSTRCR